MIVGNPTEFAIASEMTVAYERLSFRGLGFFTIFVGGFQYGVLDHHATMLACSFDEVERRIRNRGMHISPLGIETSSEAIATAVASVMYSDSDGDLCIPISRTKLEAAVVGNDLLWAPDGDAAFDDGSKVLQLDYGKFVRILGFRMTSDFRPESGTLRDVILGEALFYGLLQEWRQEFLRHWTLAPKSKEDPVS